MMEYPFLLFAPYHFAYLLAVVGSVLHTQQLCVGPSIQVSILSTDVAIASISWLALAAEHGIREDAQVHAVGIFIAVVAPVLARITRLADLKEKIEGFRIPVLQ